MLTFRSFRNADPPLLASLWRRRLEQSSRLQPISTDLLEQLVFAKLYFDYDGLIIACDDGRPVGFAHAGFGPNRTYSWISPDPGVTCLIYAAPDGGEDEVAASLLERCEHYLRGRGAKSLLGGGVWPLSPFYVGLNGGGDLPGVLDSDRYARRAFQDCGYRETERIVRMRCDLSGFEPPIDRRQMNIRRQTTVEVVGDAPTQSWWEACVFGEFDLTRFELKPRQGGAAVATATFRGTTPGCAAAIGSAVDLIEIDVSVDYRRAGLALFLLNHAFRWFLRQGIDAVELQTRESDSPAAAVFSKLGFQRVEQGGVWRKDV
ncbi:MAG: GNAT family N-acetyltransferase [Pirellulales bacterium]|nr:GNAT family N-acetyltransferase [Pirellulales bacterium]